MTLPNPDVNRLIKWFEAFEHRINLSLSYSPEYLAKQLLGSNFAEVEEFGLTVFREFILAQPPISIDEIISKTLKNWAARSVIVQHQN
jgi:hypothetical protein